MKSNLRDACPFEDTLQHIVHTVRGDGAAVGGGKHVFIIGLFLLRFQNFYRLRGNCHRTVGVLCFQRGFHDLAIDAGNLPPHPDDALPHINIFPFQSQQFSPAEPGGQLYVVHFIDPAAFGFFQESLNCSAEIVCISLCSTLGRKQAFVEFSRMISYATARSMAEEIT